MVDEQRVSRFLRCTTYCVLKIPSGRGSLKRLLWQTSLYHNPGRKELLLAHSWRNSQSPIELKMSKRGDGAPEKMEVLPPAQNVTLEQT